LDWKPVLVVKVSGATRPGLWAILQASSFSEEVYPSSDGAYRVVVPARNAQYTDLQNTLEDAFKPESEGGETNDKRILELRDREKRRSTSRLSRVVYYKGIETKLPRSPELLVQQLREARLVTIEARSTQRRRLIIVPPLEPLECFGDAADIIKNFTEGPSLKRV